MTAYGPYVCLPYAVSVCHSSAIGMLRIQLLVAGQGKHCNAHGPPLPNGKRSCKACWEAQHEAVPWGIFCKHGTQVRVCSIHLVCRRSDYQVQKSRCRPCKGSGFCPHGRFAFQCLDCESAVKCNHGSYKHRCKTCWSAFKAICNSTRTRYAGPKSLCPTHGQQHCVKCKFPTRCFPPKSLRM